MSWWKRRAPEPSEAPTIALQDVTLDIGRGEFVSVSGPSGCGKSTLRSVLAFLDTPTSGRYWFNGRLSDQLTMPERARIRNAEIGLIFQSFNAALERVTNEVARGDAPGQANGHSRHRQPHRPAHDRAVDGSGLGAKRHP